ncbi:MAG: hypothetical protein ABIR15_02675 [Chitinophagaceae bacterium]
MSNHKGSVTLSAAEVKNNGIGKYFIMIKKDLHDMTVIKRQF